MFFRRIFLSFVSLIVSLTVFTQGTWTQKANFGGVARYDATGFSIGTKGYIGTGAGNYSGPFYNDFWEWDQTTNIWTQKANFGGTNIAGAIGFSIGLKGYIGTGSDNLTPACPCKNDLWEYDPSTNTWVQKANFAGTARVFSIAFSIGTKGYIGTGYDGTSKNDFWEWDQSSNTWTQKANFGGTARMLTTGFAIGTKGYVATGWNGSAHYNDLWEWDQGTNTWTQKANFPGQARGESVGFSICNYGFIGTGSPHIGGYQSLSDFWQYDPSTNTWSQMANFGGGLRELAVGFSIGSKGYIGTGWVNDSPLNLKNDFWEYTPSAPNLITNGDFSAGNTGFTSGYSYTTYNTVEGQYWVGTNPQLWNGAMASCSDHTSSSGNMLIVNGALSANVSVFCQTVNVTPNTVYTISFWGMTASSLLNPAQLGIYINSSAISSPFTLPNSTCNWQQYSATWNSGINTTANICLIDQNIQAYGNDFGVDDISFTGSTCNALSVNISATNILCNGQCAGTGTANPVNGISPYSFNWSNGQSTQTATGLCVGTYSVLIKDASGETNSATVAITQPTALSVSANATSATCLYNNGSATVNTSGGTPGYTYTWNPSGETTSTATGLIAGNYSVLVTDANGCTNMQTVTVSATNPLTASTSSIHTGCTTNDATVIPANGNAPYTYSWNNGQTTQTATGLAAGNYTVAVSDSYGCANTNTVGINPTPPLTYSFSPTTNVSCFGNNNGSASVNVSGGTPSYTYSWNCSPVQTTQTATGLTAGNYTVTVHDSLGCIFSDTISIATPQPLSNSFNTTNVDCFGNNTGSAGMNVSGGTPAYTYLWSSIPVQTIQTISGLYAGVYSVTVTDSHGCSLSDTVLIQSPTGLSAFSPNITNALCFGENSGSATVNAIGGTPGYSYSWNPTAQTVSTATGLTAGVYTITITDNNGCIVKTLIPITQPTQLNSTSSQTNILCFGNSTGNATVTISGGIPGYIYSWSPSLQTTSAATGLSSGTYTVSVSDANGCAYDTTVTLSQPLAPLSSLISSVNILCNGNSTGSAGVAVSGGTPAYTYMWSTNSTTQQISNLSAGTYSVTFTDANGCSADSSITITQPPLLAAGISPDTSICSGTAASDSIMAFGGTPGYTYFWMPSGATTSSVVFSPSANITYTAQVTDANGCSVSQLITQVTVNPVPTALFSSSLDKCSHCLQLSDESTNAISWMWNFGDNDTSTLQNPNHCFSNEGVYIITLIVNSSPQCKNAFSLPDSVFGYEFAPVIPNVFTPNGDGVNDVFRISGLDKCSPYSLKIYDRWGILVFETEKTDFSWDGRTSAGAFASEGTYYYILSNSNSSKKGFVTLLR